MDLLQHFRQFIREENLFQQNSKLLIAVSGGMDSVVLCELCRQAGFSFTIAHCNFQLRDEESTRDEQFVRRLGDKYNVEVMVKSFDTKKYAADNKLSIQVAARELRYHWFYDLLNKQENTTWASSEGPGFILTAHHADDNIETMLMNFFKGTGIAGLRAILPKQAKLIRPLLFARKAWIHQFASEHKLEFVEDSSNMSDKYTRNYFRNQLLPAIQKVFPQVDDNLANNLGRFREIEQLYLQAIESHKKKLLEPKGNEVHIAVLKLKKSFPLETIIYEIIKEYGFTSHQTKDVVDLIDGETGKYIQSGLFRIIKNRNWLIISPNKTEESQTIIINEEERKVAFRKGTLDFKEMDFASWQLSASPGIAQLDLAEIRYPLILRKRKQGDYFYPLGLNKKKKLNRFLSDKKLSLTDKENTWVLEMNKKIIWVVGQRIDDRFKITGKTSKILQVDFIPGQRSY